jgi:hypothetical protein
MNKRKMLSPDERAKIAERLTDISSVLRRFPYPMMAPQSTIDGLVAELESIMRLNMDQHYGPVTFFDRVRKRQRLAQMIQSRRRDYEHDMKHQGRSNFKEGWQ